MEQNLSNDLINKIAVENVELFPKLCLLNKYWYKRFKGSEVQYRYHLMKFKKFVQKMKEWPQPPYKRISIIRNNPKIFFLDATKPEHPMYNLVQEFYIPNYQKICKYKELLEKIAKKRNIKLPKDIFEAPLREENIENDLIFDSYKKFLSLIYFVDEYNKNWRKYTEQNEKVLNNEHFSSTSFGKSTIIFLLAFGAVGAYKLYRKWKQ
jgi:hypothetical protein